MDILLSELLRRYRSGEEDVELLYRIARYISRSANYQTVSDLEDDDLQELSKLVAEEQRSRRLQVQLKALDAPAALRDVEGDYTICYWTEAVTVPCRVGLNLQQSIVKYSAYLGFAGEHLIRWIDTEAPTVLLPPTTLPEPGRRYVASIVYED